MITQLTRLIARQDMHLVEDALGVAALGVLLVAALHIPVFA